MKYQIDDKFFGNIFCRSVATGKQVTRAKDNWQLAPGTMAADLATVAFHSLSAETRICVGARMSARVRGCGCGWGCASVWAQWTVCKYVHLVYMQVCGELVCGCKSCCCPLLFLHVVSVSLCQQLVPLLLSLLVRVCVCVCVGTALFSPLWCFLPTCPRSRISPSRYPFGSLTVFVLILRLF